MNLNVVNVIVFGVGAVLIYAAIKDQNPKDVVLKAFKQAAPAKPKPKGGGGVTSGNTANGPRPSSV